MPVGRNKHKLLDDLPRGLECNVEDVCHVPDDALAAHPAAFANLSIRVSWTSPERCPGSGLIPAHPDGILLRHEPGQTSDP